MPYRQKAIVVTTGEPLVLNACDQSVIHDLFEDAPKMPGVTKDEITGLDADGPAVYDLVMFCVDMLREKRQFRPTLGARPSNHEI